MTPGLGFFFEKDFLFATPLKSLGEGMMKVDTFKERSHIVDVYERRGTLFSNF
jgi:hypothetical protein